MEIRFPATTPRVSRSQSLYATDVIVVEGVQFEDGQRRIVVGPDITDDTIKALATALIEMDHRDAAIRWVTQLLDPKPDGSQ
jgi:hypothetical protein